MKITEIKVINKHIIDGSTALIEVHTDEGITGIGSTSAPIPEIDEAKCVSDRSLRPPSDIQIRSDSKGHSREVDRRCMPTTS